MAAQVRYRSHIVLMYAMVRPRVVGDWTDCLFVIPAHYVAWAMIERWAHNENSGDVDDS
jgi:hypothetical protein